MNVLKSFLICALALAGALVSGMMVTGCSSDHSTTPSAVETSPITVQESVQQEDLTSTIPEGALQDDPVLEVGNSLSRAVSSVSSSQAISKAHAMLGTNPYGKYYCLKYVRTWSGLGSKYATAEDARRNYASKGLLRRDSVSNAPKGAWIFYSWGSTGHVALACESGMVHQDNGAANGRIAHDSDRKLSLTYLGYVKFEDAIRGW